MASASARASSATGAVGPTAGADVAASAGVARQALGEEADHVEAARLVEQWTGATIAPFATAEPALPDPSAAPDAALDPESRANATLEQPL